MMKPGNIAIFAGTLPIVSVFTAYAIAVSQGHVPDCLPLFEGCTTISSTGRQGPERLFFLATMIPSAMLMMLYWFLMRQWLRRIQHGRLREIGVIFLLGMTSAVFLIVYTVALGFIDPAYAIQRRIGVTLFFSCSLVAQLMVSNLVFKLVKAGVLSIPCGLHYYLAGICGLMLLTGLITIPVSIYVSNGYIAENIIEWNYAVIMYLFYVVTGVIWRVTGYRLSFHTD